MHSAKLHLRRREVPITTSETIQGDGIFDSLKRAGSAISGAVKAVHHETIGAAKNYHHLVQDRQKGDELERTLMERIKALNEERRQLTEYIKQQGAEVPKPMTVNGKGAINRYINEKANEEAEAFGHRTAELNQKIRALTAYNAILRQTAESIGRHVRHAVFVRNRVATNQLEHGPPEEPDEYSNPYIHRDQHGRHQLIGEGVRYGRTSMSPALGGRGPEPKKKIDDGSSSGLADVASSVGAATANPYVAAGTAVAGAVGKLSGQLGDAIDQGRRTTFLIDQANGNLEKERNQNKLESINQQAQLVRDMKHRRYWDFNDFSPSKLKLSRFGFANKEQSLNPPPGSKFEKQLNAADDALEDYVQAMIDKINAQKEAALQQKYSKIIGNGMLNVHKRGDAKMTAVMYGKGIDGTNGMRWLPSDPEQRRRAKIYPDPNMMSDYLIK